MSNKISTAQYIIEEIYNYSADVSFPEIFTTLIRLNKTWHYVGNEYFNEKHNILSTYIDYVKKRKQSLNSDFSFYVRIPIIESKKFQKHLVDYVLNINDQDTISMLITTFGSNEPFNFGSSYLLTKLIINNTINLYTEKCNNTSTYTVNMLNTISENIMDHYKLFEKIPHDNIIALCLGFYRHIYNINAEMRLLDNNINKSYQEKSLITIYTKFFDALKYISTDEYVKILNYIFSNKFLGFANLSNLCEYEYALLNEDNFNINNNCVAFLYLNFLFLTIFDSLHVTSKYCYKKTYIIDKINKIHNTYPYIFNSFYNDYVTTKYHNVQRDNNNIKEFGNYVYNCIEKYFSKDCKVGLIINIIFFRHFNFIANDNSVLEQFNSHFTYLFR